ncbi:hypothetical protein [Chitinophaga sp. Cy-1792]|uniref:hypothetical protein n=1 Tax=Chitinophaga sp. Cy-1792 TaxID=2608339 RepID=UPI001420330A|nr:hypothetical protein [Chitinophaga sp. Cy-1792]NIG52558.1 hypothetical protein [Chitinophaga sp. Cy-1792]
MRKLFSILSLAACGLMACNQQRGEKTMDRSAYDVITEKSYVYREMKPAPGPLSDSIQQLKKEMTDYLDQHGFKRHMAGKDSLLFVRSNAQEVVIDLPTPQDVWEANTIIVFDPAKNPRFINLHKGTGQLEHYINSK